MKTEAWRVVLTGLSLTCVTATALFLMVAANPKDASTYGSSPLVYAAGSAVLAIAFNRASSWLPRRAVTSPASHEYSRLSNS
jgi:acetylornithine/succinyldiaminopimelate/putrescine aminotransferase